MTDLLFFCGILLLGGGVILWCEMEDRRFWRAFYTAQQPSEPYTLSDTHAWEVGVSGVAKSRRCSLEVPYTNSLPETICVGQRPPPPPDGANFPNSASPRNW